MGIPKKLKNRSYEELQRLDQDTRKAMAEWGKKDLYYLTREILGYDLLCERIHSPICAFLVNFGLRLKMLLEPRGTYKSTICCIGLPIFILLNNPNATILIASADLDRGRKWIANIKAVYEHCKKFRALYPEHINKDAGCWVDDRITVRTRDDYRVQVPSISIASPDQIKTGDHFYFIIIDDAVVEENSQTKLMRDRVINFIKLCFSLAERKGVIILSGTRYHYGDAHGYFMGRGRKEMLEFLKKNGVLDEKVNTFEVLMKSVYDPELYNNSIRVNQFPEVFTDAELLEIEFQQGPYIFNAQYQLSTVSGTRRIFHKEWFNYYKPEDIYDEMGRRKPMYIIILGDPGAGMSKEASKTAFLTFGVQGEKINLLDRRSGRWSPDEVLENIVDLQFTFNPHFFGIESIAFQQWIKRALDEYTKNQGVGRINIQDLIANRGSLTQEYMILGIVPYFSQGRVFIDPTFEDFEEQFTQYPDVDFIDYVRAMSYLPDVIPLASSHSHSRPRIFNYYEPDSDLTGR